MWPERNSVAWEGVNICLGSSVIQWEGDTCSGFRFGGRIEKIILTTRYFMICSRMTHICIFHEMLSL